jgi:hypothetical protein
MSVPRPFKGVVALASVTVAGYLYGRYLLEGGDVRWWLWVPITVIVLVLALAEWHREHEPSREERRVRKYWSKPRWAPDPEGVSDQRWWDGTKFTEQIYGRRGIDPNTSEATAVQDGVTLCPIDGKVQFLTQASAMKAAKKIKDQRLRRGDDQSPLNRSYHHYVGPNGQGCDCWHHTSGGAPAPPTLSAPPTTASPAPAPPATAKHAQAAKIVSGATARQIVMATQHQPPPGPPSGTRLSLGQEELKLLESSVQSTRKGVAAEDAAFDEVGQRGDWKCWRNVFKRDSGKRYSLGLETDLLVSTSTNEIVLVEAKWRVGSEEQRQKAVEQLSRRAKWLAKRLEVDPQNIGILVFSYQEPGAVDSFVAKPSNLLSAIEDATRQLTGLSDPEWERLSRLLGGNDITVAAELEKAGAHSAVQWWTQPLFLDSYQGQTMRCDGLVLVPGSIAVLFIHDGGSAAESHKRACEQTEVLESALQLKAKIVLIHARRPTHQQEPVLHDDRESLIIGVNHLAEYLMKGSSGDPWAEDQVVKLEEAKNDSHH